MKAVDIIPGDYEVLRYSKLLRVTIVGVEPREYRAYSDSRDWHGHMKVSKFAIDSAGEKYTLQNVKRPWPEAEYAVKDARGARQEAIITALREELVGHVGKAFNYKGITDDGIDIRLSVEEAEELFERLTK